MYHPARLWGVVFASVAIIFITDIYVVIKGIRKKKVGMLDVLPSLSLPFLILLMLTDSTLTVSEKVVDSAIAFVCAVSAAINIYVLRKKVPHNS